MPPKHPPTEFGYIMAALAQFGIQWELVGTLDEYDKFIDSLNTRDLTKLADVFEEMERRNHFIAVDQWIGSIKSSELSDEYNTLFRSLLLFDKLSEHGIEPFNKRKIRSITFGPQLAIECDWSALDKELKPWTVPAERYGIYQYESDIAKFFERMTKKEYKELLAFKSRLDKDGDKLIKWSDTHRETHPREAALLDYLQLVLDGVT